MGNKYSTVNNKHSKLRSTQAKPNKQKDPKFSVHFTHFIALLRLKANKKIPTHNKRKVRGTQLKS